MKDLFLVEPNKKYQKSFENYALTYRKINDEHYFNKYKKALESFQDYLKNLLNYSLGNDLSQGEAIKIGIEEVILTCNIENTASKKI